VIQALPRHETVKVVSALLVSRWTQGEGADGLWGHGVVMFLLCLDVLSIFNATVLVVIDSESSDEGPGTECLGDPKLMWECVDPEDAEKYHFDDHLRRKVVKRRYGVGAAGPFFSGADAALDIGNVFVFATYVEFGPQVVDYSPSGTFKFGVAEDICDAKTSLAIDPIYSM
jgi:hypothetical protein